MKKWILLLLTLSFYAVSPLVAQAEEADFKVLQGDVLQVTVWKEDGMDHELVVLPDGTITFPLAGTLKVDGMTPAEVGNAIKLKLNNTIPDAAVSVIVKSPLGHTVNVLGQVTKPGEVVMTRRMSVMQALSQAGGLTPYADTDDIRILRKGKDKDVSIDFPYDDIADGEKLEKNVYLQPGDVIVVPTAGLF